MASANQEAFLYVQQNVSELRKLGKEWGLSQAEINRCVQKALAVKVDKLSTQQTDTTVQSVRFKARKAWSQCRCLVLGCLTVFGLVMLVAGVTTGLLMYKARSIYPSRFLLEHGYTISRAIRLLSVPLINNYRVDKFYYKECIFDNPLYAELPVDCGLCKNHKAVKELKVKSPTLKTALLAYPLVHRGIQTPVDLAAIQELARKHRPSLQGEQITCTADWMRFVSDLAGDDLADKILQEDNFFCEWESKERMFLSQIMRKLFPRPSILPKETEVQLQKYLFVEGKGAASRVLPTSMLGGYTWYAQGSGSRTVMFQPYKECEETCQSFQITVNQGDIVTYPADRWRVKLQENGQDMSISFVGFILV